MRYAIQRLLFALAGATVGAILVALVEARAAAEQGGASYPSLALTDAALLGPLALAIGVAVFGFGVFLEPAGARPPTEHLGAWRRLDVLPRSRLAALAPLAALSSLGAITATAILARSVLANDTPAAAGLMLGLGTVAIVIVFVGITLGLVGPLRRALVIAAEKRPALLDPTRTLAGTLAIVVAVVAVGCGAGDTGGDGVSPFAIFGVLRRSELDLRPVVDLGAIALSAYLVPIAFASARRTTGLRSLVAVLVVLAPIVVLARAAGTMGDDRKLTRAIESHAPFGRIALGVLRRATDRDHDGASPWFGGGDCNDHDRAISPLAVDKPGNGIDEDCDGVDMPAPPPPPPPPPVAVKAAFPRGLNVVLITVDTLRLDVGFAGYPKPTTPNLDRLAERAVVFDRAYSLASYTGKSVGPLLIGKYPSETVRDGGHFNKYGPENVFLAERLKAAGVKTLGASAHWYFAPWSGLTQGIDTWDLSAQPQGGQGDNDTSITSSQLSDAAIRLLRGQSASAEDGGAKNFFMWVHYVDPHAQYMPHDGAPDFLGDGRGGAAAARAAYDGEVWFTDKQVGRLIDVLMQPPFAGTTAIVVTSDHGEVFGEHNMSWHGMEIWEPLVRVPLLVYVPELPPHHVPNKRGAVDVVPTILDLFDVTAPAGELSGQSLAPDLLTDKGPYAERDVLVDMPVGPYTLMRKAVITGEGAGMKLIWSGGKNYQLYDLGTDPDEANDLAADQERFDPVFKAFQTARARCNEIDVPADPP